jgi:hypothetical protein
VLGPWCFGRRGGTMVWMAHPTTNAKRHQSAV